MPSAQQISSLRHPTEVDMELVQQVIDDHEQACRLVEDKIDIQMSLLKRLQKEKQRHLDNIQYCRSIITLARRIPREVLGKIFEICASSGWFRAPLAASQVCSAWREASLYPRAWSNLYIDCASSGVLNRTTLWLSKAQEAPLHITIDVFGESPYISPLLDLIAQHQHQWYTFDIHAASCTLANRVTSRCFTYSPYLREVRILTTKTEPDGVPLDFRALQEAPRLFQLHLEQPDIFAWDASPTMKSQITDLNIKLASQDLLTSSFTGVSLISILQDLLELRCLKLELSEPKKRVFVTDNTPELELPNLESLTLTISDDATSLLNYLQTPSLKSLSIQTSAEAISDPSIAQHLINFLKYSPALRALELYDVGVPREHLIHCFSLMPQLEELRLHDSDISDIELQALTGSSGYCPLLTRLDLRWCSYFSGRTLVDLVKSRILDHDQKIMAQSRSLREIEEITAINCLHVEEQDVISLAQLTICRVVTREDDVCVERECCDNARYRQRMKFRHLMDISDPPTSSFRLVLDQ